MTVTVRVLSVTEKKGCRKKKVKCWVPFLIRKIKLDQDKYH
jgi:hypothetical protein